LNVNLLVGLALGALIAFISWRIRALTVSGALAATITGGLIFGLGGLSWAALLFAFFISSSALSRLLTKQKMAVNEKFSKGSRRDWGQVLANGGLGALLVIAHAAFPGDPVPWIAFCGAMAAVNADTWATELGVLSAREPRMITNGRTVERGASGGISLAGSLAAFGGAATIGLAAACFPTEFAASPGFPIPLILAAVLGGLSGSFFDSFLGATVQAIYTCPQCQKETERHPTHSCGASTHLKRGWAWLNNDWVNFFCSAAGAITTWLLSQVVM
jgi:uncharacterized protein (TIGR00297 family)